MRIRMRNRILFHADADPGADHGYQNDADPRLIFHTFRLDICKLMRIRFRIQLINVEADPDADPDFI
jgi:hypothetical protein